ncbi:Regulatory protein BlaR1 [Pirellula sp. SH-Sr6A]|uniref:M56 family metallopeptidase n=1 Tax=Pirellula sp. SH-Sr6A TaxID=1632865 RepID=UPI00078B3286|nr:M56 family metallopeptidase [Pirellula sp. SH-Sr6A]AMV34951.1 Regulatory protein BlaR1 [Pirellula sp. SH-Sr6A]
MNWIETVNTYLPAFKFATAVALPFVIPLFAEVFPRRFSADLRCKLWLLAMFSMSAAPFLYRVDVPLLITSRTTAQAARPLSDRSNESDDASPSNSHPILDGQSGAELRRRPAALPESPTLSNATGSQFNAVSKSNPLFSLSTLYSAVVCVLLCKVLYTHWRAFLIRSRSEPVERLGGHSFLQGWSNQHSISIRTSRDIRVPTVVGLIRPAILLPKDTANWPAEKLMAVVQHESAHITRRDIFWTTVAFALRAIFWFNPLAWLAVERITRLRELACDDVASKQAISAYSYAEHLVAIASELSITREKSLLTASTASAVQQSELKLRLRHILDARQNRAPSSLWSTLSFAVAFSSVAAFCGAFLPSSIIQTVLASETPPTTKTTQDTVLFSGYVKDVQGNPLAGVRIYPGMWQSELSEQDRINSETTTNEDGYFEWRTPLVLVLNITKYGYLYQQIEVGEPNELQIVLQDAFKIRGVVLGPDSKPVAGAKISAFIEADVAQPPRTIIVTDAQGMFEHAGVSRRFISVAAIDDDGQAGTLANASSMDKQNIIQLHPPKNVTIRAKDHMGNPVPDAKITLGSWNKSGAVRFSEKTNDNGEVVWPKAPSGTLLLAAMHPGFRTAWEILDTQSSATAEITLYPPLDFSCTAVDDETGESIKDFYVTRRYERGFSGRFEDETIDLGSLPATFRRWPLIGDRSKDGVLTFVSNNAFEKMVLRVHADGYQLLEESIASNATPQLRRNYRLTKLKHDKGTEIQVVGPDGKPAADTYLQVQTPGIWRSLRFDPDYMEAENLVYPNINLKTNSAGMLFLPATPKVGTVTAWGDAGWYFDNLNSFDPTKPLVLQPYSRVRIRLPLNMRQDRRATFVLRKYVRVSPQKTSFRNSLSIRLNPSRGDIPDEIVVERALGGTLSLVHTPFKLNDPSRTESVLASFEVEPGSEMLIDLTGTSKPTGN